MARGSLILVIVVLGFGTLGCQPADPLDTRISAGSTAALALWRSRTAGVTAAQWKEFDVAIQELKYLIMSESETSGSEAVNRTLMSRIDGRSIRDVLVEGWQFRLDRLRSMREQLGEVFEGTARLRTRPGDYESANYLDSRRKNQTDRMTTLIDDLEHARAVLERLGVPDLPAGGTVSSDSPQRSGRDVPGFGLPAASIRAP